MCASVLHIIRHSSLTQVTQKLGACLQKEKVIVTAECGGKQRHEPFAIKNINILQIRPLQIILMRIIATIFIYFINLLHILVTKNLLVEQLLCKCMIRVHFKQHVQSRS